jgi:hypothetical protein
MQPEEIHRPHNRKDGVIMDLRRVLAVLAAVVTAQVIPTLPAAAQQVGTQMVSGLPWRSGASADPPFGTWRGRPLDVRVVGVQHDTWAQMLKQLSGGFFWKNCSQTPLCVVSLAMFPRSNAGQHQQCKGGSFDENHRQIADRIAAVRSNAIVRLGWEANSSGSHPWRIRSVSDIEPYRGCFQRLARIHKARGLRIEWTDAKNGPIDELASYPGDDVVDFWGVHYYDSGPKKSTQATWDSYVGRTGYGLNWWLAQAKQRGKKLAVPEWGVWKNGEPNPDNPVYIADMFR